MKNLLVFASYGLLLVYITLQHIKHKRLNDNCDVVKQHYTQSVSNTSTLKSHYTIKDSLRLLSEKSVLKANSTIVSLRGKQTLQLSTVLHKNKSIVVRIAEDYCYSCYEMFFSLLKNYASKKTAIPIVIWAHSDNTRGLNLFLKEKDLNYPVFLTEEVLPFSCENAKAPYIFQIDMQGLCTDFYIVDKTQIHMSKIYLDRYLL